MVSKRSTSAKDGRRLVSRSFDSIRCGTPRSRQAIGKPIGGPRQLATLLAPPSSARMADASRRRPHTPFSEWDAGYRQSPSDHRCWATTDKWISDIAYSPDGHYLVSISDDGKPCDSGDMTSGRQIGEPEAFRPWAATAYVIFSH